MERAHQRKFPRIAADFSVEFTLEGNVYRARALTLGGGGLLLGTSEQLSPGTEFSLQFRPAKHLPVMSARARVRYWDPEQGAGIEFIEIAPEHRELILRLIHHRMSEKRRFPRAPLPTQVEHEAGSSIGFSRDISAGGMFIETQERLAVGAKIRILFHLEEAGPIIRATAEVLYSILKLGIGVRFLEVAPEDEARIRAYVAGVATQ
jgi:c-di-GMP-binding flagellar brake protein YcgR